jgi:hypothetical protein
VYGKSSTTIRVNYSQLFLRKPPLVVNNVVPHSKKLLGRFSDWIQLNPFPFHQIPIVLNYSCMGQIVNIYWTVERVFLSCKKKAFLTKPGPLMVQTAIVVGLKPHPHINF